MQVSQVVWRDSREVDVARAVRVRRRRVWRLKFILLGGGVFG